MNSIIVLARRQEGAATPAAAALVAALLVVTVVIMQIGAAVVDRHRAQTAADLAALAGAGAPGGADCAAAERVARDNGADTVECAAWQGDVVVRVSMSERTAVPGLGRAGAIARAGPAD